MRDTLRGFFDLLGYLYQIYAGREAARRVGAVAGMAVVIGARVTFSQGCLVRRGGGQGFFAVPLRATFRLRCVGVRFDSLDELLHAAFRVQRWPAEGAIDAGVSRLGSHGLGDAEQNSVAVQDEQ